MNPSKLPILIFVLLCAVNSGAAEPAIRVVRGHDTGTSVLANGDFESSSGGKPSQWTPAPQGFELAPGQGRNNSRALCCVNQTNSGWVGASQTIALNRTEPIPLRVRGWSKAENVSGSSDGDYSLYVDIVYADDSPSWGNTGDFRTGTHDWQQREVMLFPDKPVKTITVYCLMRRHTGKAWFDDITVEEIKSDESGLLFQGVAVSPLGKRGPVAGAPDVLQTTDGLKVSVTDDVVTSVKAGAKELAGTAPSGFLVRDAGANSDFYNFKGGQCQELGLKLRTSYKSEGGHLVVEGRLSDTSAKDRAVTLVFALPVDGAGWRWADDIRRTRAVEGKRDYANVVGVRCGATGTMSLYPLAALYTANEGLALGIDMAQPAQYRLGYHAGTRQLYIAYDFGLVPETRNFPASADFRFVLYRFDPHWGFRAAFGKYMEIFPEYFRVRSTEQGLWMPFTDISTVQGWEDFGFKYHEGNNNVAWDDAHGILSFRYTEPMTWWMRMGRELPRTMDEAIRVRDTMASQGNGRERQMASVARAAGMLDDSGQPALLFRNEPWCNGAVWSLNPNPALPAIEGSAEAGSKTANAGQNAATVYWNDTIKERLYGPDAKAHLDGEYLDSLEGYVTAELNFRREHFRYTTVPLTFSSDDKHPALFKGLAVYEFARWFCDDVHRLGKLMFANGVPYRFTFLCPWLDVSGTETDWLQAGKYHPVSDAQMNLWRTMSGAKPYVLLMNTDYNAFGTEMVERYLQRSLFYGMFPSMFSHNAAENPYWQNPKWYNRDRHLFKKYVPLVKRAAEAGWHPVTAASCDNPSVFVERFGPDAQGVVYLTLLNDTTTKQSGRLQLERERLQLKGEVTARDLVSGTQLGGMEISLEPQEAKLIELRGK